MSLFAVFFLVLAVCERGMLVDDSTMSEEARLEAYLFKDYDVERRPVKNYTNIVKVTVEIYPVYLSVNEVADTVTLYNLLIITWRDEFLTWNSENFSGIDYLIVDGEKIWQPESSLYKSDINKQDALSSSPVACFIYKSGFVRCMPYVSHTAMCEPDPRRWPYDSLNCSLMFVSWDHHGKEINITSATILVADAYYEENRGWALSRSSRPPGISGPKKSLPSLRFSFILKRRSATHAAIVIVPAICLALLTTAFGLLEPGPLRLGVAMTSLLIQIIFIMGISQYVPSHGDYPAYIIMFYRNSVLITTIMILTTMMLMSLTKLTRPPPRLVAFVVNICNIGLVKWLTFDEFNANNLLLQAIVPEDAENNGRMEQERTANLKWQKFASVFNKLFFLIIGFSYISLIFMYVLL